MGVYCLTIDTSPKTKMKSFVAYCRTSTENQREEKTIELQVESLKEYAESQGIRIQEWFKDDGASGGLEHRPELARLMVYLEGNPEVKGILIYKLDRLARDLYIQEGLIKEFAKLEKEVVSTLEPDLASNDPFRKAFRQMLGVFAEFEKAMITLRMKNGRERAVAKGRWHGGQVYGYDTKDGKLLLNEKEAEVVRKIFYLRRYKSLTPARIARLLNEQGIQTKRKTSKWRQLTVSKILNNKIYKGHILYQGRFHKGKHEPIIK